MLTGLKVLYYEISLNRLKGPYPAFISKLIDDKIKSVDMRVFMEDSFALYDMKNIPLYNPLDSQDRFWCQTEISLNRFQKISNIINDQEIDPTLEKTKNITIENKNGAFVHLLNERGTSEQEIYVSPNTQIIIVNY